MYMYTYVCVNACMSFSFIMINMTCLIFGMMIYYTYTCIESDLCFLCPLRTELNKGYAFVNFTNRSAASKFSESTNNKRWDYFHSRKIRQIAQARVQVHM